MGSLKQTGTIAAVLALGMYGGLQAQMTGGDAHPVPRFRGASFVLANYTWAGSFSVYGAGRVGAAMGVVGIVHNPRTAYEAIMVGAGTRMRLAPRSGVMLVVAAVGATDAPSVRFYAVPAVGVGRLSVNGTAVAQQPLSASGSRKVAIDPLRLTIRLGRGVQAGAEATFSATSGRASSVGGGPAVQLRLPGASLTLTWVWQTHADRPQLRGSLNAAF